MISVMACLRIAYHERLPVSETPILLYKMYAGVLQPRPNWQVS
jgi:hypothetical protein